MTCFVVYNIASTVARTHTENKGAATRIANGLNRKRVAEWAGNVARAEARGFLSTDEIADMYPTPVPVFAATTLADYNANVVKMVERRNALTGKPFMEASNVPFTSSAASETYHCS